MKRPTLGQGRVGDLLNGFQTTCVIIAAHQIGLFSALARGGKSTADLAAETGTRATALERLVRALVSIEVLEYRDGLVALTPDGRALAPRDGISTLIRDEYLPAWTQLATSLSDGTPAFDRLFGMSVWEHRRKHAHLNEAFGRMVQGPPVHEIEAILSAYDFGGRGQVVDVGGGSGWLLAAVLKRHPTATGTLFDQPHVVDGAVANLERAGVRSRARLVSGSFFDSVPAEKDLYMLQSVLHDWSDRDCTKILETCRKAMTRTSRLILLERILPEPGQPASRALAMLDLHMMVVLGGQERSLAEYDALLSSAGLERTNVFTTADFAPDVIEAVAIP